MYPALVLPSVDFVFAWAQAAIDCPRCAADEEAPLRILENVLAEMAMSMLPFVVVGVVGAMLYRLVVSAWPARPATAPLTGGALHGRAEIHAVLLRVRAGSEAESLQRRALDASSTQQ